mgnify:CR=1 FL=1
MLFYRADLVCLFNTKESRTLPRSFYIVFCITIQYLLLNLGRNTLLYFYTVVPVDDSLDPGVVAFSVGIASWSELTAFSLSSFNWFSSA